MKIQFKKLSHVFILTLLLIGCEESIQGKSSGVHTINELAPQALSILQAGLADSNPKVRMNAIEVVSDTKRTELMPSVQKLIKNEYVPVRFAAALAVGDMKYVPAKSLVKRLSTAPDENSRIAAAYALACLGATEHLKTIREAVRSKDQTVRANSITLLGKYGDENDLKLLYRALRDEDSGDKVRFQTVTAIAQLGDQKIINKLWPMILSAYADDRVVGIQAMGTLGTSKAGDILATKLGDVVPAVRLAAAGQLGKLGDKSGESVVKEVFARNLTAGLDDKEAEQVYMMAALAIGQIRSGSLSKYLAELLKNESKFVRISAAKAILQYQM